MAELIQACSKYSDVALPFDVGGVGGGQPLADGQAGLVVLRGRGQVPAGPRDVPEPFADESGWSVWPPTS
jgi:hypothetical protein